MAKKNVNFQAEPEVIKSFDDMLVEYEKATGISLKKGNCHEVAMKDYIIKLKKQIKILKKG